MCYNVSPRKNKNFFDKKKSLKYVREHVSIPTDNGVVVARWSLLIHSRNMAKGAFDWEIWIKILKSGFRICNRTQNPKTDFNAEIPVFGFSFLPFDWEIRKRIWKIVLKNSGLARARISREKKTAVHENSFANPFSDFPIER